MSSLNDSPKSLIEYAKKYLLDHMRAAGMSNGEIEANIMAMPNSNPLKSHFARQFCEMLPAEERFEAIQRLQRQMLMSEE